MKSTMAKGKSKMEIKSVGGRTKSKFIAFKMRSQSLKDKIDYVKDMLKEFLIKFKLEGKYTFP